MICEVRVFDT